MNLDLLSKFVNDFLPILTRVTLVSSLLIIAILLLELIMNFNEFQTKNHPKILLIITTGNAIIYFLCTFINLIIEKQ